MSLYLAILLLATATPAAFSVITQYLRRVFIPFSLFPLYLWTKCRTYSKKPPEKSILSPVAVNVYHHHGQGSSSAAAATGDAAHKSKAATTPSPSFSPHPVKSKSRIKPTITKAAGGNKGANTKKTKVALSSKKVQKKKSDGSSSSKRRLHRLNTVVGWPSQSSTEDEENSLDVSISSIDTTYNNSPLPSPHLPRKPPPYTKSRLPSLQEEEEDEEEELDYRSSSDDSSEGPLRKKQKIKLKKEEMKDEVKDMEEEENEKEKNPNPSTKPPGHRQHPVTKAKTDCLQGE